MNKTNIHSLAFVTALILASGTVEVADFARNQRSFSGE